MNPIRGMVSNYATQQRTAGMPQAGGGFNSMAAGNKVYGGGRPMPTMGKISDKSGYAMRDGKMAARREALMRRAGGM